MLVFFLIIGGLIYLATVYIKQKHGTFDAFIDEAKRQLSGDEDEDEETGFIEDQDSPPDSTNRIAPSPEEPDTETVPQPTQEQLSKWKELEEMCKPMGIRSMYTGFKVDEETGDFVPEYDNIDCCFEQPWKNEGECTSGQQKQVRGILNEDLCDVEPEKEQMIDCCSYGEWENDGECVDGVQKQNRQIFNEEMCTDTTTTREIDCCSYGEWEPEGGCVDGNQNYTRIITNSQLCEDTSLKKTEPCCFPLDWMNEGDCKATGMQKQVRAHINRGLCTGDDYEDVQELACCYRGKWETVRECDYKEGKIQQKRINVNDEICRAEGDPATTRTLDCCKISEWQNDGDCDEVNGVQKQIRTFEMAETCPPNEKTTQEVPCCKRGPWNADPAWNGGVCNFDGKIRVLREIELFDTCRNNDAGDPENALTETQDCCHKSEWEKDGFCGDEEFGKQKYTRTITNPEMCGDDGDEFGLETEFMEDCCALTPWEIDTSKDEGGQNYCRPDGTRWEKRELVNRTLCRGDSEYLAYEDRMRRVPCCYKTAWENDNVCGFYENGKQKEIRRIENPDMCDLDPMDDLSSENYTPCCDIGPWSYGGENLDGQLGKVKEVRDVYNCPPDVDDKQYEKTVCYIGGFEDYGCRGEIRQQRRTVLNCPVGTSSTQEVEEDRPQETTMNHCYNIARVTNITVGGTGNFTNYYCRFATRKRDDNTGLLGGEDIYVTFNKDSPAGTLDFDPPRDIRGVLAYGKTYGKDGKLEMKFWNGDFLIRKMDLDVEKRIDLVLSYADAEKMIVTGGKYEPKDNWKRRVSLKPMIEDFT
jgi:hypothetical protein